METLPHALHSFMLMLLTVFLLLPPTQQHVLLSLGKLLRILHPNFHAILDPAVAESQSIWDVVEGPGGPWATTGTFLGAWMVPTRGYPRATSPHFRFLCHFGVWPGTQNPSKVELLTDKVVYGWLFLAISGAKANIMQFCINFEVKIDEKQRFFDCVFALLHALFENLANLENRCFT